MLSRFNSGLYGTGINPLPATSEWCMSTSKNQTNLDQVSSCEKHRSHLSSFSWEECGIKWLQLKVRSSICLVELKEIINILARIATLPSEIWNGYVLNVKWKY
jgi:hypothetical protein